MDVKQLLKSWVLLALGVLLAAATASGIRYESTGSLVFAVVLLSLCNVVLKPLLMLFSLPFIILTFGIGIWLINALLFLLVGEIVPGFVVDGFGNALWGALVVSLTGGLANLLFAAREGGTGGMTVRVRHWENRPGADRRRSGGARKSVDKDDDDVIDV